jgi:hypothetical protein
MGHALDVFLTADYGLVYVDCTDIDTIVRVESGKEYRGVDAYRITKANIRDDSWWDVLSWYYYMSSNSGGHSVTSKIEIYW